jgi:UDP-glucose 4-epimerase
MKVLVTGGAGYIGSTVCSAMIDSGHTPVIVDSLVTGRHEFAAGRPFYRGDIADGALIDRIFADHSDIGAVVHCAALIVVPESVKQPLRYFRENVSKTVSLLEHMIRNGCRQLLFSSSASIYRPGDDFSVDEHAPVEPTSPYAQSKAMIDSIIAGCAAAGELEAVSLRYFNPIGADPQMRTGLQTLNPTHALGKMIEAWENGTVFPVTGADWPTRDGTGIRDYIHVWDLARAHVNAITRLETVLSASESPGYQVINLGTGTGTTVRELLDAFSCVIGEPLACQEVGRRPGDAVGAFARSQRSANLLGWRPERSLTEGIRDALTWRARLKDML